MSADRALLLGDEALREANALSADAGTADEHFVAFAVGWFHWQRAMARPEAEGTQDRTAAVCHLASVFLSRPEAVPEPLRAAFEQVAVSHGWPGVDPVAVTEYAVGIASVADRFDQALLLFRVAVTAADEHHPRRAWFLGNLGLAQLLLFERTHEEGALRASVRSLRTALASVPEGSPLRASYMNNLAQALYKVASPEGIAEDTAAASEAVETMRAALAALPDDDPSRAAFLSNLGAILQVRAAQIRDADLMAEAVQVGRQAVAAAPRAVVALDRLRVAQEGLFRLTEESAPLLEAVQTGRDLMAVLPESDANRARYLSDVGRMLHAAFLETRDVSVLKEAADVWRAAVKACPPDSPGYVICHNNLGIACRMLSETLADRDLLMEAVYSAYEAVNRTGENTIEHARYLSNLGQVLVTLARRTADEPALEQGVLEEAVQAGRTAAASIQDADYRYIHLRALADSLRALFTVTADPSLRIEAQACLREAAESLAAPTISRIQDYRDLAASMTEPDEAQEALTALESAIDLVAFLAPNRLSRTEREQRVRRLAGLASQAAAAALDAGLPVRAVELLERARGVLVADAVGVRGSELGRLRWRAPELADRLDALRSRLDAADHADAWRDVGHFEFPTDRLPASDLPLIAERRAFYAQWHDLLEDIRALPGFEDFLDVPDVERLTRTGRIPGPVVLVTSCSYRSDALIVTGDPSDPVRVVPLPGLTETDVIANAARLTPAYRAMSGAAFDRDGRDLNPPHAAPDDGIFEVLAWLWTTIAEPVLVALGHTGTPADGEEWPRVWWCPVGPLAFLPLHAAGRHEGHAGQAGEPGEPSEAGQPGQPSEAGQAVMDRVISSYTTTVRALTSHRSDTGPGGQPSGEPDAGSVLIVGVPDTPGAPLPGVIEETKAISTLMRDVTMLADPTRDAVLAALPAHGVAHFACHGRVDRGNPLRSHLVLADYDVRPLTVADISTLRLSGGLAFLSACDTATTAERLADESVQLTSAFHLAGYRHVVGALWPIDDALAADLAAEFYRWLTDDGQRPPRLQSCAEALHHAVRQLRRRRPDMPLLWAAYLHTGA
ncbi:CHAT domain-containing protein [Catenulispora rubra]|uniref:CHAT domain-containing protein n=1 Tax=Catenulispora rubra TaxID=280293 RepID=UPI00189271D2|nr:CHAT domain-containing protein [Catenulispora rubra]